MSKHPSNIVKSPDPGGGGAGGDWEEVGRYNVRLDVPRAYGEQKYHVHVYEKSGTEVGVESCDGTKSHGKTLKDSKLSKKDIDKIRNSDLYKKGSKKQKKLNEAMQKIEDQGLNLNKAADIAVAAGIVAAATATWFFPADDVVAWGNLLRALASA